MLSTYMSEATGSVIGRFHPVIGHEDPYGE
jgi:hypothetical protein